MVIPNRLLYSPFSIKKVLTMRLLDTQNGQSNITPFIRTTYRIFPIDYWTNKRLFLLILDKQILAENKTIRLRKKCVSYAAYGPYVYTIHEYIRGYRCVVKGGRREGSSPIHKQEENVRECYRRDKYQWFSGEALTT